MAGETIQQGDLKAPGGTPRPTPLAMCPMAAMCKGMMERPPSGFFAMLAGTVMIALGILIFFEPRVVVWIIGGAFVLFGTALFMMANFLRRLGVQVRDT